MPAKKYTAEVLGPLVKSSTSFSQVIRKLGLKPTGGNHRHIAGRIREAELDTSHFRGQVSAQIEAISSDVLREVVEGALSVAQVLQHFGFSDEGRPHHTLTKRLKDEGIDTSHFRGQAWNRGDTAATNPRVATMVAKRTHPNELLFVENSPVVSGGGARLTKRLLAMGWEYKCALCGICEWRGTRLILHLDHINGIHNDNRLINLRFLCPNCHSQTDTYCAKNKNRANRASEPRAHYSCYTTDTRAWRNRLYALVLGTSG